MQLTGRRALITGASRGVGLAIARRFGALGARVAIAARGREALADAQRALARDGVDAFAQAADVSDADQCAKFVAAAAERFGGLDILVCNAAIHPNRGRSVLETSVTDWDDVMAANLRSVFVLVQCAVPIMKLTGRGWIVTIGSIGGRSIPDGLNCAYRASKFGLRGLTWSLGKALKEDNIAVSSILPGSVDTSMIGPGRAAGRLDPSDIATVAAFLVNLEPDMVIPEVTVSPRSEIGGPLCPYG